MHEHGYGRICLIHGGALGDFVLALRVVGALKLAWPRAFVDVLGRLEVASLAVGRAGVDGVASIDMPGFHTLFGETGEPDRACVDHLRQFDLIVDMLGGPGGTLGRRIGQACPDSCVASIETGLRDGFSGHITDQWLADLGDVLGRYFSAVPVPMVTFDQPHRLEARAKLQRLVPTAGQAIVMLHPGSGGRAKCWPMASFQALADALWQNDVQPVYLVGPVELDILGEQVVTTLGTHAPVIGDASVTDAASLIDAADAYVGNDAGMTHIATAVETPTVALFGPTDPAVWRPLGPHVRVLTGKGSPDDPFAGLDVATVRRAVLDCLATPPRSA